MCSLVVSFCFTDELSKVVNDCLKEAKRPALIVPPVDAKDLCCERIFSRSVSLSALLGDILLS